MCKMRFKINWISCRSRYLELTIHKVSQQKSSSSQTSNIPQIDFDHWKLLKVKNNS